MANIFQQFSQPVRSVMDYQADYEAQDMRREQLAGARRQNALADLTAQQTRQTMADQQRSNALIKAAYGGGADGVVGRLRATGDRAAIELADKQETQALGRGKTEAETSKTAAETAALQAKAKYEATDRLAQKIGMIRTPEDLAAYEEEGIALGVFPEQARGKTIAKAQQLGGIAQWQQFAAKAAVPILEDFKAQASMAQAKLQSDTSIKTTGMNNATSLQTTGMTNATTRRGQDIGASTAAAGRAQADRQFVARQDAEKPEKPLPAAVLKSVTEARDNAATIDRLASSFKPDFAGKGVFGLGADMQMGVSGNLGADRDAVEWWKNYRKQAELVERHALFGAALTPTEQASWRSADIAPGMDSKVVAKNLATRKELSAKVAEATKQDMIDAGHSEGRISKIAGRGEAKPAANPAGGPAKITDDAGYNALPSGATFIGPDGKTRRKP